MKRHIVRIVCLIKIRLLKLSIIHQPINRIILKNYLRNHEIVKLHLGSGTEHWPGYLNIDVNPKTNPDLILYVQDLSIFLDNSVDLIECYHLFEHLTISEAQHSLLEWFRILKPGAELHIETPNLSVCFQEIGKYFDEFGYDLAMAGIFGYLPDIETEGVFQLHKWGWTIDTITNQLKEIGFLEISSEPIRQNWRKAAIFNRDMHIRSVKP